MGNEESALEDEADNQQLTMKKFDPYSKMGEQIIVTVEEIPILEFPAGEKLPPRQGGYCRKSWTCCHCKHANKSGKWNVCQNPSQAPLKRISPGIQQSQCRHERCKGCRPNDFALFPGSEHLPIRRWPPRALVEEELEMQTDVCRQLAHQNMMKEVDAAIRMDKEQKKPWRDPLTCLRVGPWPGGY